MNDQAHDLALALRGAYLTRHRRADASFARYGVTADQFVLPDLLARESAATQQTLVLRTYSGSARQRADGEGRGEEGRGDHPHPLFGAPPGGYLVCDELRFTPVPDAAQ